MVHRVMQSRRNTDSRFDPLESGGGTFGWTAFQTQANMTAMQLQGAGKMLGDASVNPGKQLRVVMAQTHRKTKSEKPLDGQKSFSNKSRPSKAKASELTLVCSKPSLLPRLPSCRLRSPYSLRLIAWNPLLSSIFGLARDILP
ncbi:hypothetical protein AB1N83_012889 [Pleurotus pulmonarius]